MDAHWWFIAALIALGLLVILFRGWPTERLASIVASLFANSRPSIDSGSSTRRVKPHRPGAIQPLGDTATMFKSMLLFVDNAIASRLALSALARSASRLSGECLRRMINGELVAIGRQSLPYHAVQIIATNLVLAGMAELDESGFSATEVGRDIAKLLRHDGNG